MAAHAGRGGEFAPWRGGRAVRPAPRKRAVDCPLAGRSRRIPRYAGGHAAGYAVLELLQQLQIAELLQPINLLRAGELGLEHDAPLQVRGQKAVPRNAGHLRQVRVDMRDGPHLH